MGDGLERLNAVVQQYETQYVRRQWHTGAHQADPAGNLWLQLTGDFYQTLKECDSFLTRHGYLKNSRPSIASNLRWWLSAEGEVKNLTARLRFHTQKVEFFSTPSQFDAVIRHGRDLQQLRRQVANLEKMMVHGVEQSPKPLAGVLSPNLKAKIESEFSRHQPSWSTEDLAWPLKESFDAFAFHFARGTVNFNPSLELGDVPDLSQYLELAKSIWVLESIRESSTFRATSTQSRWADYMREFEDDLNGQLHRFETNEINRPPEQQILELPGSNFIIETDEVAKTGKGANGDLMDPGVAGPLEEKILQIDLVSDSCNRESSLSVFRETDSDFRLMTSTRQTDSLVTQHDQDFEVNMERHRLTPVYASPSQSGLPRHSLLIFNERGKKPRAFDFLESAHARKLQQALTGYRVHHDMPVSRWCINGSERPGEFGKGMLQLWQFKPLRPIPLSSSSQPSDVASSPGSLRSSALSFGLPNPPPVKSIESSSLEGENEDSFDIFKWPGFSNAPITPISTRRESQASSSTGPTSLQYLEKRSPARFSVSTKYSDVKSPQAGRSYSNTSKLTASSRNGSQDIQVDSRATSGKTAVTRTSVMSPVKGPRGDGTELLRPQPPVLVISTLQDRKYGFLHLTRKPMHRNAEIEPSLLTCGQLTRAYVLSQGRVGAAIRTNIVTESF